MGWVDIVLCRPCHDISGIIAVQHKQFNFVQQGTKLVAVTWLVFAAWPALAQAISRASGPDPLLDSGPTVACAAGVDFAPGVDVNGNAVVPADTAGRRVPVPDSIAIPISRNRNTPARPAPGSGRDRQSTDNASSNASNRDSAYVALDGRKLEPLLNPPPCNVVH